MAETDEKARPKYDEALKHILDEINKSRSAENIHHLAEAYSLLRKSPVASDS
ncbi:hypothetical protein [uncultured Gordonia sp.]|uniref:hypothetical protein n=1 Tax=uncultured Gordonia sp. TaxID=198437 RepID=UPI00259327CF|nr:hypothetical protein [uncultured Gordonia sp.]